MRVSLNWLKEYVSINLPAKELAHQLAMAGTEVGRIETIGGEWENIVIGQISAIMPHPNADRLKLAEVDLGAEKETVVCGAPNVKVGDKVPFARLGAKLIDPHTGKTIVLQPAKIRGVVSKGMACSEKELGISEDHEGLMILPPEAPVGAPLAGFLGDTILDLEVTPNRPDCLSVLGIAREVAALTDSKVVLPAAAYPEEVPPVGELAQVEIAAPELCSRYCATVILGVTIGPSPSWMQKRLVSYGMRPINNIVDITNYVMVEYGQPLHAFDYQKIRGKKIIVRRAREGEIVMSLDGVERKLNQEDLLITDVEGAVAIAGVMGGANSEVTPDTTSILLESANFNRACIRRTSARLGLRSEASIRFERGLRPELAFEAAKRATHLIAGIGGGKVARGIIDTYPGRTPPVYIPFTTSEIKRVLGIDLSLEQITNILTSLGFNYEIGSNSELRVIPPWWRSDVSQPADLVEEVARIYGYDRIPLTLLSSSLPSYKPQFLLDLKDKVRDILVSSGMQEIITYTLTRPERERLAYIEPAAEPSPALRLANPLSSEQEYLRTSLRAGLLTTLGANQRNVEEGIRIFEAGRVFLPRDKDLPEEREVLAGILCGPRSELSWNTADGTIGFYDAKGLVENLFHSLGCDAQFDGGSDASLLQGRTSRVTLQGTPIGVLGEVHPSVLKAFDISGAAYLFEIDLSALLPHSSAIQRKYAPIAKFPGATRDIAIVLDTKVTSREVRKIIATSPLVDKVLLFDVYTGDKIPRGKKSLAWRITWQAYDRTLTDEEVDRAQEQILDKLAQQFGATLRS